MHCTAESYSLTGQQLPSIPIPHDCVIREISQQDDWLILAFEDNLSVHDSIGSIHPGAQSLTMKFHLTVPDYSEFLTCERRKYETVYVMRKWRALNKLPKNRQGLTYLSHLVGHGEIQIDLFAGDPCLLRLVADRVILEWQE